MGQIEVSEYLVHFAAIFKSFSSRSPDIRRYQNQLLRANLLFRIASNYWQLGGDGFGIDLALGSSSARGPSASGAAKTVIRS